MKKVLFCFFVVPVSFVPLYQNSRSFFFVVDILKSKLIVVCLFFSFVRSNVSLPYSPFNSIKIINILKKKNGYLFSEKIVGHCWRT